jgi:SAM-dependent methyltransferase
MTEWSDYYTQTLDADLYIRHLFGQREFLVSILESGGQKILEVGAGTGAMSIFLSQLGREVTTLDNDPKILELAKVNREKFSGKNQLVLGNAFTLPFPDNSFDLVFHQGLLEHFSDDDIHKLIKEHLRVAPVVMFSVPNANYPLREFGNERLLSQSAWEALLRPYKIEMSRVYALKIFPKWYLPRVPIQYMAKLVRR